MLLFVAGFVAAASLLGFVLLRALPGDAEVDRRVRVPDDVALERLLEGGNSEFSMAWMLGDLGGGLTGGCENRLSRSNLAEDKGAGGLAGP